jgi:hypothetical protein
MMNDKEKKKETQNSHHHLRHSLDAKRSFSIPPVASILTSPRALNSSTQQQEPPSTRSSKQKTTVRQKRKARAEYELIL